MKCTRVELAEYLLEWWRAAHLALAELSQPCFFRIECQKEIA